MARTKPTPTKKIPDQSRGAKRPSAPPVYRPSTRAQLEIRRIQRSTNLLISRAAISRLVRRIENEIKPDFWLRVEAIDVFYREAGD